MQIRRGTIADADAIARVHVDTWRAAYAGIVPAAHLASLDVTQRAQRWRENLATFGDEKFLYVAEEADRVIGFTAGGPERDQDTVYRGELYALYLLPACHRRGIGRALVATVARELRERGYTNMLIWVLADNPARNFYAALGGQPVREKTVTIGGKALREIGYGWDALTQFRPPE